ncbi:hypothetical protein [Kitasatospora sp. NPDC051914]
MPATPKAYGTSDGYTADLEPVRFTLGPDGTITVTRLATDVGSPGGS